MASSLSRHLRAWSSIASARHRPHARPSPSPSLPSYPPPPLARRHFEPAPGTSTNPKQDDTPTHPALARRPTNRQIPFAHVFVLDPDTNKLSPRKRSLEDLLAAYTRTGERRVIELVASSPDPIVRIATRSDVEARYREVKRAIKKGARDGEAPKEVQLTWGVAPADVAHKMRKARQDLEKGYRVVVTIAIRKGHRPSSQQELVALADEISDALAGAGQECKERETTQRSLVLSFRKAKVDEVALQSR